MTSYQDLKDKPKRFQSLTGHILEEFSTRSLFLYAISSFGVIDCIILNRNKSINLMVVNLLCKITYKLLLQCFKFS